MSTPILVILILNIVTMVLSLMQIAVHQFKVTRDRHLDEIVHSGREWAVFQRKDILIITDEEYHLLYASESAEHLFPGMFIGEHGKPSAKVVELMKKEGPTVEIGGFAFEKTMAPVEIQGRIQGYALFLQDVTRLHSMERDLAKAREEARNAIETRNRFLTNMSHEIRTPMNVAMGMTEMLTREDLPESKRKEYIQNIRTSNHALITMMNDIADYSEIEADTIEIHPSEYKPQEFLKSLSGATLSRIGGKRVEFVLDADPDLPKILYGDAERIRQILISILNSAVRFTMHGSIQMSMQIKNIDLDNISIRYSVKDTGLGFRQKDLEKLFTPFAHAGAAGTQYNEGNGLELSIAKRLVELMGGEMDVKSEYGKGTEISFTLEQKIMDSHPGVHRESTDSPYISAVVKNEQLKKNIIKLATHYKLHYLEYDEVYTMQQHLDILITDDDKLNFQGSRAYLTDPTCRVVILQNPMIEVVTRQDAYVMNKPIYAGTFVEMLDHRDEKPQRVALQGQSNGSFKCPNAHILIVDDNPMNRKVAIGMIAPYEAIVDTAADGSEAVQMIRDNSYQIVFMDHMMPVMDGIEATSELRKDPGFKDLPIIFLTANDVLDAKKAMQDAGMSDFMAKPITRASMEQILKKWLPKDYLIFENEGPAGSVGLNSSVVEDRGMETEGLPQEKEWISKTEDLYAEDMGSLAESDLGSHQPELGVQTIEAGEATETENVMSGDLHSGNEMSTDSEAEKVLEEPSAMQGASEVRTAPAGVSSPEFDPNLPGINRWEGIENCGTEEMFTEMLGDYHDLISEKAAKVEKLLADEDIKNYTIEVHALKSTSHMIGLQSLSDAFRELEQLGHAGKVDELKEKTPEVLRCYREYIDILSDYGQKVSDDAETIPMDLFIENLQRIHDCMDTFDLDGADAAIRVIDGYRIPDEYNEATKRLRNMVTDVAMEDAMELTLKLIAKIESDRR